MMRVSALCYITAGYTEAQRMARPALGRGGRCVPFNCFALAQWSAGAQKADRFCQHCQGAGRNR